MFIDASALLAILLDEPEATALGEAIAAAAPRLTSPLALFETTAGLMSRKNMPRGVAEDRVAELLAVGEIEVMAITDEVGRIAQQAFDRYGKGRGHPAQLNMGDCFAYACAKVYGGPLLYKGNDFSRTDLA